MDERYPGLDALELPHEDLQPSFLYSSNTAHYFPSSHIYDESLKQLSGQVAHGPTPSASPSSLSQPYDQPPSIVSSTSGASVPSTGSSTGGSPRVAPCHPSLRHNKWPESPHGLSFAPGIVETDPTMADTFTLTEIESNAMTANEKYHGFVDPNLIQHLEAPLVQQLSSAPQPGLLHAFPYLPSQATQRQSPVQSDTSGYEPPPSASTFRQSTPASYLSNGAFIPYPQSQAARRFSIASNHSRNSAASPGANSVDDDAKEKDRCSECGKPFKDLKAHMLTHQSERPEKCPISICSYHTKGFARKYDKNRHTLTHYKGTMICGFCPGSGSASEKSFNRADVFKRHLTAVHGVEQAPPNGRKKSSATNPATKVSTISGDATGKCSTCSATFEDAQEFYEHLDDCVLRIVQQEEPSEAINDRILRAVNDDEDVQETLNKHRLPTDADMNNTDTNDSEIDEVDNDEEAFKEEENVDSDLSEEASKVTDKRVSPTSLRGPHSYSMAPGDSYLSTMKGNGVSKSSRTPTGGKRGMTVSKGGVPLVGKGRRRRKHYPASWGCTAEQMKMKKRVLCVYDGPRRLWKDDMMLDNDFEVRMRIGDGSTYVTDLDVETLKRATAFHEATEEEKGPWIEQDVDLDSLMS